jgi:hypothetical protein
MSSVKTRLEPMDGPTPQDVVIGPRGDLPMFEGQEQESLICPGCGDEVTRGVSTLTMIALFRPPGRLLFRCDCGACSLVGEESV